MKTKKTTSKVPRPCNQSYNTFRRISKAYFYIGQKFEKKILLYKMKNFYSRRLMMVKAAVDQSRIA